MKNNFFGQALSHINNQEYAVALECLNKALDIEPFNVEMFYCRSYCKLHLQDYEGFLNDHWLGLSLSSPENFIKELFAHVVNDIEKLNKRLESEKNDLITLRRRGLLKLFMLDTKGAIDDLNIAADLGENHPEVYYGLGYAFYVASNYDECVRYFDKFIEQDPDYPYTYYYRAQSYIKLGRYQEAVADCDKVIESLGNYLLVHSTRTRAVMALEQDGERE